MHQEDRGSLPASNDAVGKGTVIGNLMSFAEGQIVNDRTIEVISHIGYRIPIVGAGIGSVLPNIRPQHSITTLAGTGVQRVGIGIVRENGKAMAKRSSNSDLE